MRDIRFRAWCERTQEYNHYVEIYCYKDGSAGWSASNQNNKPKGVSENFILEQFTGKKDFKGVDIYEGDIVEFDAREWGDNKSNKHVISWDELNAEWCWGGGSTSDMEWRTVIGNIHQNPELL